MQVSEIVASVNFHDSSVIEVFQQNDIVKLRIDLCMWKQDGYREGDDELKEVVLEFTNVTDYMWDSEKSEADVDYDTILEVSYSDGLLKIILHDDEISILSFKCNTVMFEYK